MSLTPIHPRQWSAIVKGYDPETMVWDSRAGADLHGAWAGVRNGARGGSRAGPVPLADNVSL
jgi:hypothetical protein